MSEPLQQLEGCDADLREKCSNVALAWARSALSLSSRPAEMRSGSSGRMRSAAFWVTLLAVSILLYVLLSHAVVGLRSILIDYVHTRAWLVAADLIYRPGCSYF